MYKLTKIYKNIKKIHADRHHIIVVVYNLTRYQSHRNFGIWFALHISC